ncbi:hypothetical protein LUZ61_011588 [Rhynchospora tenuis]|uniref:Uncharacterized protein n=1 Tax=Rhynchospora tenuis TaxID=198213 RepID=A0AAD6A1H6_9POAL|nr:hypothetical protein LUZ61_011588 [Rhynchospora tenuis]
MEKEVMKQKPSCKISDVASTRNLKRQSSSAACCWTPGCSHPSLSKIHSCAEGDRIKKKRVSVDSNTTLGTTQHKMVKPIEVRMMSKEKKKEASKPIVPFSKNQSERAKVRTGMSNPLAVKKSPMKVISKKKFHYSPMDRCGSGVTDPKRWASRVSLQPQSRLSRARAENSVSALYHHDKRPKKSMPHLAARSIRLNAYQNNAAYYGPKKGNRPADKREEVKRCLRTFSVRTRNQLRDIESGKKRPNMEGKRVDRIVASIMRKRKETLNTDKPVVGPVPGVEVGDEYRYRAEPCILGLHRPLQAGIDTTVRNGKRIATSVVVSGGYPDEVVNEDVLIYSGAGGKPTGKPGHTKPKDQKLEGGNLGLKNSLDMKIPVRVIYGWDTSKRGKAMMTYSYDGLYEVENYWLDTRTYKVKGKLMAADGFKFQLRRMKGQPEQNWCKLKRIQMSKVREGLCSKDISLGKEEHPICVVNTINNEKVPQFRYITKTVYPSWYQKSWPKGCKCKSQCSVETCSCVVKNKGKIPFNFDGAIVQEKPLIYECGPACGCPPSCYNRVSQNGIQFPLEVFKTKMRGWGVRSLLSIPSGSFVCEYVGIWRPSSDMGVRSSEGVKEWFTVDAQELGNVGRFINRSCSPNLFAQHVLFDHDDKKMPHIMFFAAENIPPLKELTYQYKYGSVHDSDGKVKVKECYHGTS